MAEIDVVQIRHYKKLAYFLSNFQIETYIEREKSENFWYSRFDLWWEKNPAFSEDLVRGLILVNNGDIVGFIGCIPSYFLLSGKQIIVFNETTLRVDKQFRGIDSINMIFKLVDYTKESIHFRAGGLEEARKMQAWLGFKNIFSKERIKTYYIIIKPWNIIINRFPNLVANKLLKIILYQLTFFYKLIINVLINMAQEHYDVRIIEEADYLFDELWDSTKTKFLNTNVRTSEILNWYCSNKGVHRNIILGCYEGNNLLGYLLCTCEQETILKKITVVDLWGYIDDEKVVNSLLKRLLIFGADHDYDLVILPVFHERIKTSCKKYFIHRPSMSMQFKAKKEVLKKITNDSSYFSYLQGDNGLF